MRASIATKATCEVIAPFTLAPGALPLAAVSNRGNEGERLLIATSLPVLPRLTQVPLTLRGSLGIYPALFCGTPSESPSSRSGDSAIAVLVGSTAQIRHVDSRKLG